MSKEFKGYFPIWCLIVALLNIILWIIDLERSNGFYISYIITNIALVVQLCISYFALSKKRVLSSPMMYRSIGAVIITAALNIYILYSAYIDPVLGVLLPDLPLFGFLLRKADIPKVIIIVDAVILILNYILVILFAQHGEMLTARDQHVVEKTEIMRKLVAKAKTLAEVNDTPELRKIYEEIKYSKNISSIEKEEYAVRIDALLTDLENNVNSESYEEAIKEILILIKRINN